MIPSPELGLFLWKSEDRSQSHCVHKFALEAVDFHNRCSFPDSRTRLFPKMSWQFVALQQQLDVKFGLFSLRLSSAWQP